MSLEKELDQTITALEKQRKRGESYSFEVGILLILKSQRELLKRTRKGV